MHQKKLHNRPNTWLRLKPGTISKLVQHLIPNKIIQVISCMYKYGSREEVQINMLFCNNDSHWLDKCYKLKQMKPDERLKMMKENQACLSCLKKAAKVHYMQTCTRRKSCPTWGCKLHHPSLIAAWRLNIYIGKQLHVLKDHCCPYLQ
jgi:hypothetical protein